jgi:hypothetical protein
MSRFDDWVASVHAVNPDCYIDPSLRSRFDDRAGYRERARVQMLLWAMGRPTHNKIDGECCPDFSCCEPDMFTKDETERWRRYHAQYGRNH